MRLPTQCLLRTTGAFDRHDADQPAAAIATVTSDTPIRGAPAPLEKGSDLNARPRSAWLHPDRLQFVAAARRVEGSAAAMRYPSMPDPTTLKQ